MLRIEISAHNSEVYSTLYKYFHQMYAKCVQIIIKSSWCQGPLYYIIIKVYARTTSSSKNGGMILSHSVWSSTFFHGLPIFLLQNQALPSSSLNKIPLTLNGYGYGYSESQSSWKQRITCKFSQFSNKKC